jgi:exodeoxyribonuclease VII small subunit
MAEEGEGFDQVLQRLRVVVEKLEGGQLSLEQALGAFEEGVRLSQRGAKMLDEAERRVEILTRGDATAPFEGEGPAR